MRSEGRYACSIRSHIKWIYSNIPRGGDTRDAPVISRSRQADDPHVVYQAYKVENLPCGYIGRRRQYTTMTFEGIHFAVCCDLPGYLPRDDDVPPLRVPRTPPRPALTSPLRASRASEATTSGWTARPTRLRRPANCPRPPRRRWVSSGAKSRVTSTASTRPRPTARVLGGFHGGFVAVLPLPRVEGCA